MRWGGFFYPHRVAVKPMTLGAGLGESYGPERVIDAEVKDQQRLVRGTDGREVVSSSSITVALDELVPIGSLVTVWPGGTHERMSSVIAIEVNDNGATALDSFQVLSLE